MTVSFEKTAVEAGTRRLAARWSVELEQDLKNMNGIDIDTELTNAMSYEIQAEIDREMLMRMVQVALNAGSGNGYSTWTPASADGRWMAERNRDLYAKIIVEANRIAVRNRRGAANFIVATPKVCAILEMLPEFQWMQVQGNVNTQPVGIARVGNLGGRFNVYRDTRSEAQTVAQGHATAGARTTEVNYVLLGYKGPEFYDTGLIYCPYIPVMVQRTIGPNDFSKACTSDNRDHRYHSVIIIILNLKELSLESSFFVQLSTKASLIESNKIPILSSIVPSRRTIGNLYLDIYSSNISIISFLKVLSILLTPSSSNGILGSV